MQHTLTQKEMKNAKGLMKQIRLSNVTGKPAILQYMQPPWRLHSVHSEATLDTSSNQHLSKSLFRCTVNHNTTLSLHEQSAFGIQQSIQLDASCEDNRIFLRSQKAPRNFSHGRSRSASCLPSLDVVYYCLTPRSCQICATRQQHRHLRLRALGVRQQTNEKESDKSLGFDSRDEYIEDCLSKNRAGGNQVVSVLFFCPPGCREGSDEQGSLKS